MTSIHDIRTGASITVKEGVYYVTDQQGNSVLVTCDEYKAVKKYREVRK